MRALGSRTRWAFTLCFFGAPVALAVSMGVVPMEWLFSSEGLVVILVASAAGFVLYQSILVDAFLFQISTYQNGCHLERAHQLARLCHWESSPGGVRWSPSAWDFFGGTPPSVGDVSWISSEFMDAFLRHRSIAEISGRSSLVFRKAGSDDCEKVWLRESVERVGDTGFVGVVQDVTEARNAERQMSLSANVYRSMGDGVIVTTVDGYIVDINPAMERISLYSRDEAIGNKPTIFQSGLQGNEFYEEMWRHLSTLGRWSGDIKNKKKNGEIYIQSTIIEAIRNDFGDIEHYVAVCRDVTEERQIESRLTEIAYYDGLTGLANKRLFGEKLEAAIKKADKNQEIAIMMIDLDGLYFINSRHGYDMGDLVIKSTGARLDRAFGDKAFVSRFGGDEFCVAIPATSIDDIGRVAAEILSVISVPLLAHQPPGDPVATEIRITGSVGVTVFPDDFVSADKLIRHAGHAMHSAKTKGGGQFCVFSTEDDRIAQRHHEIIRSVEVAMENHEIIPFFQPKVDINTGAIVGAEALTRRISNGVAIPPSEFILDVERSSGSTPTRFTLYMINLVAGALCTWIDKGVAVPVSVNVFPANLQDSDFLTGVEYILLLHGIPAGMIELEIIESSDVGDRSAAIEAMLKLKAMGCKLSIDDFGTGYSSLDYLRKLPIETLKIDQTFVVNMLRNQDDEKIVNAIIQLARSMGFGVVAEGIEDVETAMALSRMGCRVGQGYFYSKPVPRDRFEELLSAPALPYPGATS